MTGEIIYVLLMLALLVLLGIPTGKYMAKVFNGDKTFLSPAVNGFENFIYKISSIDKKEMTWKEYTFSLVIFNIFGFLIVFILQMAQYYLPLNTQKLPNVSAHLAFNTAVSFMTNTNWQSYGGETTLSYLTQMLGLTVQNFVSAATGFAAFMAVVRGFTREKINELGNFWVDITRTILYVLLPLSIIAAIFLSGLGVVQTLKPYHNITTLEGDSQTIAVGPAASQVAIKQIGSNGGGFFNSNSSHPLENPNIYTNFIENFSILFLPLSLVFAFGYMIRNKKQANAIFLSMSILFLIGLITVIFTENLGNPIFENMGIINGANMEGKEMRFGVTKSVLWGQITTVTSNGSVNSMHDSKLPLSGLIYMFNMGIGEVIFGGVGVGIIGMLFYIMLTMFIAGLMIGRTPEFLGKKLGPYEMSMSLIALLVPFIVLLIFVAISVSIKTGLSSLNNSSAHGLSEIIYAFASAGGNNGSAFAGLNANTPYYNITLGISMLIERFITIIPALAIAGSLAQKKLVPTTDATFPTTGGLFVVMITLIVIIMGALTFFPMFSLSPILENFMLYK